jgi:hypothetical protein
VTFSIEVFSSLLERLGRVDFYFAGKRCQLNRSMQHFLEVYSQEFEILTVLLGR